MIHSNTGPCVVAGVWVCGLNEGVEHMWCEGCGVCGVGYMVYDVGLCVYMVCGVRCMWCV